MSPNRATQNKSRARLGTPSTVPATSLSRLILRKAALKVPSIAETRLALRPHHLLNFPSLLLPVLPGHWVPPPALVPTTAAPKTPRRCREGGRHRRPPSPSPMQARGADLLPGALSWSRVPPATSLALHLPAEAKCLIQQKFQPAPKQEAPGAGGCWGSAAQPSGWQEGWGHSDSSFPLRALQAADHARPSTACHLNPLEMSDTPPSCRNQASLHIPCFQDRGATTCWDEQTARHPAPAFPSAAQGRFAPIKDVFPAGSGHYERAQVCLES